jgi:hypothetical protein
MGMWDRKLGGRTNRGHIVKISEGHVGWNGSGSGKEDCGRKGIKL